MKTMILGLGNSILTDDAVGIIIARALKEIVNEPGMTIEETSTAGLDCLELLACHNKAIIVDAIQTSGGKAGTIYRFGPESLNSTRHVTSPHDVNLAIVLELGKRLGLALPDHIVIFGVEVKDADSFGEECTPEVAAAVPKCISMVLDELRNER